MLLGNANVEGALGEELSELIQAGPARHGSSDADHRRVLARKGAEGGGEDGGEGGGRVLGLLLHPCRHVEHSHAMHFVRGLEGRGVAEALLGLDVEEDRLVRGGVPKVLEDGDEVLDVMAVHRTHVVEPQLLEEDGALLAREEAAPELVDLPRHLLEVLGEEATDGLGHLTRVLEGAGGEELGGGGGERACRHHSCGRGSPCRQRHLAVLVEDDDEALV
mmetsp:Transcript_39621/g.93821  ORF Transcript_39621/g.93821 Transcript_39621/m.93821 type:complete len:219 (+) Transcript_39621:999-1655(+)